MFIGITVGHDGVTAHPSVVGAVRMDGAPFENTADSTCVVWSLNGVWSADAYGKESIGYTNDTTTFYWRNTISFPHSSRSPAQSRSSSLRIAALILSTRLLDMLTYPMHVRTDQSRRCAATKWDDMHRFVILPVCRFVCFAPRRVNHG